MQFKSGWIFILTVSSFAGLFAAPYPEPVMTMPKSPDAVNTFLVVGPFEFNGNLESDFLGGENTVSPIPGKQERGMRWEYFDDRMFSRNYDDYQDLFSFYYVKNRIKPAAHVVYAHVYIHSEKAGDIKLHLGADTWGQCFLNGKKVMTMENESGLADTAQAVVALNRGWNSLLVKTGNRTPGRLGFYLKLTDIGGAPLPELVYSVMPSGNNLQLVLPPGKKNGAAILPAAWREWPYVGMRIDAQNPAFHPSFGTYPNFMVNPALLPCASDYRLSAVGGKPPYRYVRGAGTIPPGLKITDDGRIVGTPEAGAELRDYQFKIWVTDANGESVSQDVMITLNERPNRWYEQGRLGALIHNPTKLPAERVLQAMKTMQQEGYQLAIPIAYNNGCMRFYWPSPFNKEIPAPDYIRHYKEAADKLGMKFGLYMGNLNHKNPQFTPHQQNLMVKEALERFKPVLVWFDWAGVDGTSMDSLFSMMKSIDPNLIVLVNGHVRGSQGDWDVLNVEAYGAWGSDERDWEIWPKHFPWPKKQVPETWRKAVASSWVRSGDVPTPWDSYWRVCLTLIGEGFIPNMDHTFWPFDVPYVPDEQNGLMTLRRQIADWASPAGIPPLYEAYTNVDPGSLPSASWGYDMISRDGNTLYLLIMCNRHGKSGLPHDQAMTLWPIDRKVKQVTWMNRNQVLSFKQTRTSTDRGMTMDITPVKADPVATIIKIELEPEKPKVTPPASPNLALNKKTVALSNDGKRQLMVNRYQEMNSGVDGNLTSWAQAGGEYAWTYQVDLDYVADVKRIVIKFSPSFWATHFRLLCSKDGRIWQVFQEYKTETGGTFVWKSGKPESVRYIRVQALKPDAKGMPGKQMGIAELEVYAKE